MPAIPIIALGVAAVGTGYSIYSGERAASAQNKATQAQQAQADLQAAQQKRNAIRQARLAQAQAQSAAANQGAMDTSSAAGGQGSIISQMNSNLSFLDRFNTLSDQASHALGEAQMWEKSSREASQVSSLGWAAYSNAPALQNTWNKIFK